MLPSDQPEFSLEHLAGFVELLQISLEQPLGARQLLRHFSSPRADDRSMKDIIRGAASVSGFT
jgi:hypothetical protein